MSVETIARSYTAVIKHPKTGEKVNCAFDVTVDMERLVKMLGSRAALSKHKRASSLRGAVKITARKADEL